MSIYTNPTHRLYKGTLAKDVSNQQFLYEVGMEDVTYPAVFIILMITFVILYITGVLRK